MLTRNMLKQIAPNAKEEIIGPLVGYLDEYLPKYDINSYLRVCHFIAQAAHESAGFKTLEEYASGADYEGRADLGNVKPGDGKRYKGRGIFQLTGRANYRVMGQKLGVDLENKPELAADPLISVRTACEYWNSRKLSIYADLDDVRTITRKINGGYNGFEDRKLYLSRAKAAIPKDLAITSAKPIQPPVSSDLFANVVIDTKNWPPIPRDPLVPAIVVAKKGDVSDYIDDLQSMLFRKGYNIITDGNYGPKTEAAVKDFQTKAGLQVTGTIDTDTLNRLML